MRQKGLKETSTDISIIIPTKNEGERLEKVLKAVFGQKTTYGYEVIVIDSGSTDETLDMLKQYPVRIHSIPPKEFGHAKTRNFGARLSRAGKYLVFLNHDAVPTDEEWLNNLVRSIEFEPNIKAACAAELQEIPGYFNVAGVAGYVFKNSAAKGIYIIEPHIMGKISHLPKMRQRKLFPFTTVCAIFDKKHFNKYPFNEEVEWGEDLHWAVDNSNRGFKSACSIFAKVYHYHNYSEEELLEVKTHTARLYRDIFNMEVQNIQLRPKRRFGLLAGFLQKIRRREV